MMFIYLGNLLGLDCAGIDYRIEAADWMRTDIEDRFETQVMGHPRVVLAEKRGTGFSLDVSGKREE